MKTRTILTTLAVFLGGMALALAADDPQMGTWKLNEAKSKLPASTVKNNKVVYAAAGDSVKITVDGVDNDGKPTHNEWAGKFDGKDYAVTGDADSDTRVVQEGRRRNLDFTARRAGKVMINGKVVVSADGKTRTVTTEGTDASGAKVSGMAVYDKQ